MSAALVAGAAVLGAAVGVASAVPITRVPDKVSLRAGPFPEVRGWVRTPTGWVTAAVAAGLSAAVAGRLGEQWALVGYLAFVAGLVPLTVIDLRLHLLPNRIVYPLAGASVALLGLAAVADGRGHQYERALLGALVSFAAFFVIHLISPGGLGFGDVKLSFVLGLYLGWLGWGEVAVGLFLAFVYGAVVGVALLATRVRGRKDALPFGPFLAAGTMTAILVGSELLDLYRR